MCAHFSERMKLFFNGISAGSKNRSAKAEINRKIEDLEPVIEETYSKLGAAFYEANKDNVPDQFAELFQVITDARKEIEAGKLKIQETQASYEEKRKELEAQKAALQERIKEETAQKKVEQERRKEEKERQRQEREQQRAEKERQRQEEARQKAQQEEARQKAQQEEHDEFTRERAQAEASAREKEEEDTGVGAGVKDNTDSDIVDAEEIREVNADHTPRTITPQEQAEAVKESPTSNQAEMTEVIVDSVAQDEQPGEEEATQPQDEQSGEEEAAQQQDEQSGEEEAAQAQDE